MLPDTAHVAWEKTYRSIWSRNPPVNLFARVASPEDWTFLNEIEGMTNDRLLQMAGEVSLVPPEERVADSIIMAAFSHPGISRFSDGSYGLYYATNTQIAMIREVAHHAAKVFSATNEGVSEADYRTYVGSINASLHDLRPTVWKEIHHPDDYTAAQMLGAKLRANGSDGVVYPSIRCVDGGECIGVFRPRVLTKPVQGTHFRLHYDGNRVSKWLDFRTDIWSDL